MTLSRIKPYIKGTFKSKKIAFSTEFVKRTPAIPKLIIKDIRFLIIKINIKTIVEIEIDVLLFIYINYSFSFEYIV